MKQPNFSKIFTNNREIDHKEGKVLFKHHTIGQLTLKTGHVVACDPLVLGGESKPFKNSIPPGVYPVMLSLAHFPNGDCRVAYAKIHVSDTPAVKWEMALVLEDENQSLDEDEIVGYPVDAGIGSFFDQKASKFLENDDGTLAELIINEIEKNSEKNNGLGYADIFDPKSKTNVIAFSSGWGDGVYASYFGYDNAGKIVALITDFSLFEDPDLYPE